MRNFLLISFFAIICSLTNAQNQAPSASQVETTFDPESRTFIFNYNLTDTEGDTCYVVLQQKIGTDAFYNVDQATGDVGSGIIPGNNKSITYNVPTSVDLHDIKLRIFVYDRHTPSIQEMVDQVDIDKLKSYLDSIVGRRHYKSNPNHLIYVANYVNRFMIQNGLSIGHQFFKYNNIDFPNLIGRHEGLNNQNLCLINGHYDSAEFSPGADDNGTGLAGVLEACRIMHNYYFKNNLQFTSFGNEELGLIGSIDYVLNGIQPNQNIKGLINYELLGYYSDQPNTQIIPPGFELLFPAQATQIINNQNRGDFIVNTGNSTSVPLLNMWNAASAQYVPDLKVMAFPLPGNGEIAPILRRSDHVPFWDKGYQALMITDGAETRNHNYHTANDKIETLNFEFMTKVVKAGIATLATLAEPLNASVHDIDLYNVLKTKYIQRPESIFIYPNPVDEIFSFTYRGISSENTIRIEIINTSGKVVNNYPLDKNPDGSYQIKTTHLPSGTYILQIIEGKYISNGRFLITGK